MKINISKDIKNKLKINSKLKLVAISTALALSASSCGDTELSDKLEDINLIDTNSEEDLVNGYTVLEEVPGEDFKLSIKYDCKGLKDNKWRITTDKKLMLTINTVGLKEDVKVWIDNIHMDTTIVATKKEMDGITQDSMDDRIHNSTMIGFPISDSTSLYSINNIEGQNETFIHGSYMGFSKTSSGSVDEERYLESDYLEKGVYANHISVVCGILVQGPNDKEPKGIDIDSDIYIRVYNTVKFEREDSKSVYYRQYKEDGSYKELEELPKKKTKK